MKFLKGQVVYNMAYNYKYEILEVLELGYVVRNLAHRDMRGFKITNPALLEKFETTSVPVEVLASPLWKALS